MQLLPTLALLLGPSYVEAYAVFAHFMVGNTGSFTLSDWESDIGLAQTAHIDAFALNIASGDSVNDASLSNAFTAANSLGFKLFFSFDYAGNGAWALDDVVDLINEYGANGAYYQYNGLPFVSTFEGPDNADDWSTIKESVGGCFFMPDWSSLGADAALEVGGDAVDGLFSWAAWPYGPEDMYTVIDASYLDFLNQTGTALPYMMPVSPWFYTNLPGYSKNWLWRGDDLWYDRWQQVLWVRPEFVEILTWNDYGESHYIGPLHDTEYDAFTIGDAPFNYAENMPHDGWRLFLPYLIDTYKNGVATITEEGLVTWFRLSPAASCSNGGTTGNTLGELQCTYDPADMVQDKVFYSALLSSSADVTVSIGGVSQSGSWTSIPDSGVGIYHGSVSFSGNLGDVVVTLSRSGSTIASVTGDSPISTTCTDGDTNWNAWVGSASGGSVSATPSSLDDQVCIAGKGLDNYDGLCAFTCAYGYCPIGACTCTAMGAQITVPEIVNVDGYPISGEDASYSGLCSWACNHGYCPDSACSDVEVDLSPPSTDGPFPVCSPTTTATGSTSTSGAVCIAGTGEDNYEGLCSFTCSYGYCPSDVCDCTATGTQVAPPATSDVDGCPISGEDDSYSGLCSYACSHGYCPDGACRSVASGTSCSDAVSTTTTVPSTITAAPTTTETPPTCVIAEDPDNGIGAYCVCDSYASTLPTLTGSASPCSYTTFPAVTTIAQATTVTDPYAYTETDFYSNIIACQTSSILHVGTIAATLCEGSSSTIHTAATATATPTSGYDPSYVGSYCYGHPYQLSGVDLTCPPAAFSWEVYLPDWGGPSSSKDPQACGEGFLDNLRGRCGVISAWGCTKKNGGKDTYYTFNTIIECEYWDVQDAFQAANGGDGGLWCIRDACASADPLEGATSSVLEALELFIESFDN